MAGICCDASTGYLVIDTVPMHLSAWCCVDLSPLWAPPASRGTNVIVPGAPGQRAFPRRVDQTDIALRMLVSGEEDVGGNPWPEGPIFGLQANLDYLRAHVVDPPTPPTATRAATLQLPNSATVLTADVQVLQLEELDHISEFWRGLLHLRIPAGRFA